MNDLPLVCLHGSFGCSSDWDAFVERVGRERVWCPDLPAHGERQGESVEGFAQLVEDLGRELPERCDLVGYSLGGRLALALAFAFPERVRSIVCESANPGLEEPQRTARRDTDEARAARLADDPRAFLTGFWQLPLFASFREFAGFDALTEARIVRAERDPERLAHTFAMLSPGRQPDYFERAHELVPALLFVAGERDAKYRSIGARFVERLSEGRLVVVPGAGHNVHLEQPERFAESVESFWESLA